MTVMQESRTLQLFASRFAEELEFLVTVSPGGQISGAKIGEVALDVIRIDLRRSDIGQVISELPLELRNLLLHANKNPKFEWALDRQIKMVKTVGGITG